MLLNNCISRKVLFLVSVLLLCASSLLSQTMKVSELSNQNKSVNIFYLEDSLSLQPSDVLQQYREQKLHKLDGTMINKGITPYYYWFVIEMENDLSESATVMWEFNNPAINKLEVYRANGKDIQSLGKTGDHYPFHVRPYYFHLFTYPVNLAPGETVVVLAFLDKRNENFFVGHQLRPMKDFVLYTTNLYLAFGICVGILLVVFLFNLFIFFISYDKIHFWYSIYLVLTFVQLMASEGLDFQFLYPNMPALSDVSRFCSSSLALLSLIKVMELFYKQFTMSIFFNRALAIIKWGCVVLPLLSLLVYYRFPDPVFKKIYLILFGLNVIAGILLVTVISLQRARGGFKPAWFYISATFTLFLGAILYLASTYGFISMRKTVPNVLQAGMIVEAVIISFGIVYRYYLFREENSALAVLIQKEHAEHAEAVVNMQQFEQKRIAEDLHDVLGSSLAALKLKLQKTDLQGEQLKNMLEIVDMASVDTRNISHNLMPPDFEKTDFHRLLSDYYQGLDAGSQISFRFFHSDTKHYFNKGDELMLYRIIMELTNNILRHSGATEATVQLVYYENHLELMVEDNGQGMIAHDNVGIGIKNVRSRVNYLNGEMRIDTGTHGTTIMISVLYKKKENDD